MSQTTVKKHTNRIFLVGKISEVVETRLPSGDTIHEFTLATKTETGAWMHHIIKHIAEAPLELKEGQMLQVDGSLLYEVYKGVTKAIISAKELWLV